MRRTFRQLAAVKPSRYLETGAPTGLAGLNTHANPRSALLYLYSSTLDKLKQFPETSLYRQSAEAIANHRMSIVSSVEPPGYKEWSEKAKQTVKDHPEVFTTPAGGVAHEGGKHIREEFNGKSFIVSTPKKALDDLVDEWDGEENLGPELEGTRTTAERKGQNAWGLERPGSDTKTVEWVAEPQLTAEQIEEIENKIGAGLIEEVIQVAEGEMKCADVMLRSQVWEDLEEKPVEGQWTYFMRDTAVRETQTPPQK